MFDESNEAADTRNSANPIRINILKKHTNAYHSHILKTIIKGKKS